MNKEKKHIKLHYHAVRDEVEQGRVSVQRVSGTENPADGFTKALEPAEFTKFVELLGLEDY